MEPWKPILLIVPAGLLLGIAAGQASKPVPLVKEERPWPQSVRERAEQIEPWRPIYEGRPQNLTPAAYSYRPDFDYDAFAWPDQADRSAELLAANYDYEYAYDEPHRSSSPADLPQTRRAKAELAAEHAPGATTEAVRIVAAPPPAASGVDTEIVVLPPVPPPLTPAGTVPEPVQPTRTDAF